jgi:hypothetical protein
MAFSMKLEVLSTPGTRAGRMMERMPDGVTQPRRRGLLEKLPIHPTTGSDF